MRSASSRPGWRSFAAWRRRFPCGPAARSTATTSGFWPSSAPSPSRWASIRSFLTADVTSDAFNHRSLARADVEVPALSDLLLREGEVIEFERVVEATIRSRAGDLAARRIVPGPGRTAAPLRVLPRPAGERAVPRRRLQRAVDQRGHRSRRGRSALLLPSGGRESPKAAARGAADRGHAELSGQAGRRHEPDLCALVCTLRVGLRSKLW